jgi:hypothetical protein
MPPTGSIVSASSTVTSGIHCRQAACTQRPARVAGLSAPPATGHRQHCGGGRPSSLSSQARHIHMSSTPGTSGTP